ncbi:MAG: hypothetical protein R3Y35_12570 [Clostridia bacterium]
MLSKKSLLVKVLLTDGINLKEKDICRHIQIGEQSSLSDLHSIIIESIEFDNDHLHAFFMDNRSWQGNGYYSFSEEKTNPLTGEILLEEFDLAKGEKFKYLFDFGDNWCFQCEVLDVIEEETEKAKIVFSKGKSPSQY